MRNKRNGIDEDYEKQMECSGGDERAGSTSDDGIPAVEKTPEKKKRTKPVKLRTPRSTPKKNVSVRKFKKEEPEVNASAFEKKLVAEEKARESEVAEREKDRQIKKLELEVERERIAVMDKNMAAERVQREQKELRDEERHKQEREDHKELIRFLMSR